MIHRGGHLRSTDSEFFVSENGEGSDRRPGARGLSSFVFLDTTGAHTASWEIL